MKGHGTIRLILGALLAEAVNAHSGNGVVQWDIQRSQRKQEFNMLRKRADTFEEVVTNEKARGGYFATCRLGTPGQNLTMQLDTGSSDIWVPSSRAAACRQTQIGDEGCSFGSFTPSSSTSFTVVGEGDFDIEYLDGTSSRGDYFTDVFEIGGATLQNMTMGFGISTDIDYGLVGVGYAANEAIVGSTRSSSSIYPNLPVHMVNEGLINTVAYSLWLNDLDASSGNILFGGIDTEKYQGDLTRIVIYPHQTNPDIYTGFYVALTSLEAISSSGRDTLTSESFPIAVVLDSGTTLSYLPNDLASQIWTEVGAVYSSRYQLAVLPCSMQHSKGYFTFGLGGPSGPRISVTMDELVIDLTMGEAPTFSSGQYEGQDICALGIQNFTSGPYLLGDTFLRSAYVVYDLVNNEVGIAATDFNSTDSNIVPFPSSGAPIPSATVAPDQSEVTDRPAYTSPAFEAREGFQDASENENAAVGLAPAFGTGQMLVVGVTMVLTALGSGLFFVI